MTAYYEGYSQTSASNNSSAPNGAPEGMAPSGVNDAMRQIMAAIAQMRDNKDQEDRNFFVDPCCRVAQGDGTTTLTTSYKFGLVDLVSCKATGTAVSAGTITQDATTQVTTAATPYSVEILAATITGTGKAFFRKTIESRDSQALTGQSIIFSVKCRQNTGGSINAFLTLNQFQNTDSAGTPVQLATGSGAPVSVPTATDTVVSLAYTSAGSDMSKGVELILEMDCGAVTTKNFFATDWQARIGTAVRNCRVPEFAADFTQTLRYFEKSYEYGVVAGTSQPNGPVAFRAGATIANNGNFNDCGIRFMNEKINVPTVTLYSWNTASTTGKVWDTTAAADKTASAAVISRKGYLVQNNSGGSITSGDAILHMYTADSRL